ARETAPRPDGFISVNPNTIYPLLRELEGKGMIEGRWEHPDRRSRRYYAITAAGKKEYKRLRGEVEPFLDSVIRSMTLVKREIYECRGFADHGRRRRDRLDRLDP